MTILQRLIRWFRFRRADPLDTAEVERLVAETDNFVSAIDEPKLQPIGSDFQEDRVPVEEDLDDDDDPAEEDLDSDDDPNEENHDDGADDEDIDDDDDEEETARRMSDPRWEANRRHQLELWRQRTLEGADPKLRVAVIDLLNTHIKWMTMDGISQSYPLLTKSATVQTCLATSSGRQSLYSIVRNYFDMPYPDDPFEVGNQEWFTEKDVADYIILEVNWDAEEFLTLRHEISNQ